MHLQYLRSSLEIQLSLCNLDIIHLSKVRKKDCHMMEHTNSLYNQIYVRQLNEHLAY